MQKLIRNRKLLAAVAIVTGFLITLLAIFLDYLRGRSGFDLGPVQIVGIAIGFLLFLAGLALYDNRFLRLQVRSLWILALTLFVAGFLLLVLNIYGEFRSLRNPEIYQGFLHGGKLRIPQYSPEETTQLLEMGASETVEEYAHRATSLVFDSTVHLWENLQDYDEYHHHIPIYENFILWWKVYENPELYTQYQFCDPYKAIERGVTICDQSARIMRSIWNMNGMSTRLVTLDGHTITEAQVDKTTRTWWVLDADFGVVLEYDMETVSENPDLARQAYIDAGYAESVADVISAYYGPEGNYVITERRYCEQEVQAYRLKWILPVMLVFPMTAISVTKRMLRRS
jgi:hypothetical protein